MRAKKKYEIGYGKPPKSGQFKRGESGNPKGRPTGKKTPTDLFEEEFKRKISIIEGGVTKTISYREAFVRSVARAALAGDRDARHMIYDIMKNSTDVDGAVFDEADESALHSMYEQWKESKEARDEHIDEGAGD